MEARMEKKKAKRTKLFDAAYDLFVTKGVNNTVIDDIVKKAGVAKGTFYLYFRDKYDLVDKIVLHKSELVIKEALDALEVQKQRFSMSFEEDVIFFIEYLLDFFSRNKEMLSLIHKNLSLGLRLNEAQEEGGLQQAVERFTQGFMARGESREQAQQTLYILVEMVGSVCCDAVLTQRPYTIEQIKPTLYLLVRRILC